MQRPGFSRSFAVTLDRAVYTVGPMAPPQPMSLIGPHLPRSPSLFIFYHECFIPNTEVSDIHKYVMFFSTHQQDVQ